MTLEEKIEQEKLQIEENREKLAYAVTLDNQHIFDTCLQNIKEHEQLAEWLEELKKYKGKPEGYLWDEAVQQGYNKAIDDFVANIKDSLITDYSVFSIDDIRIFIDIIEEIAEQLRVGVKNEN